MAAKTMNKSGRLSAVTLPRGVLPKLISIDQACVLLDQGRTTTYKMIANGNHQVGQRLGKSRKVELASAMAVGSGQAA